ncbi:golgin subfamily B member 1-like [Xiphophorus hellerii]|uniref:golgin subfamily B member 1-like n=1 Tax=Xiphophorus hellerii TaxID=8084 RepID=UPI0013B406D0|nr:golgin subfamily B member 1-like [Xiphophorus hellerii]
MLKWFSGEEGEPGSSGAGSPRGAAAAAGSVGAAELPVEEMAERLIQMEQLVSQLKELIREKDATLRSKDDQLKGEKEACEAKLSKLRLQNKAKVTSLTSQLEELKKRQGESGTPTHSKKGSSEGGGEQASRGKIVLLKKKVEELEQQLSLKEGELENKRKELEVQQQRGEEMDAMLTERDRRLAEKEAYIVHLQTGLAGDHPVAAAPQQKVLEVGGEMQELQLLVQSLTKKVEESEEHYSLLLEQTDSLKELLASEKEQYSQKESMFKQNIQTFKDIIIQKDNQLMEINQMHEQELFRLAAKSDASADLEQLLKALKQKLHEKEEVLNGKTQVIDVLQGEVDGRDQQIKELTERLQRLQVERESLESKMEAEKHVMRAQLRDLMEKHQVELQRLSAQHQDQMERLQTELLGQLEERHTASPAMAPPVCQEASGTGNLPTDPASVQRMAELEAQAKQKTVEASRSEAKFLKMKAWSKSRIRQLEEELKKSQAGAAPPDLTALRGRITALEEEREENQWKVDQYEELKAKSEMLEAKLVVYEEQQRTLQAELEQFTKRAASQASESGSADDTQSKVLEWQEMVAEAASARGRVREEREERAAMALRISHMEEEREALATRQQELEEELAQARGLGRPGAKKLLAPAHRSLQEDFEFDGQASFQNPGRTSENTTPMEGENMGGWWPEFSTPDTDGLRSVVEELELERNQLQEQILSLEERCQDLEEPGCSCRPG